MALLSCCHNVFCSNGISALNVSPATLTSLPSPGGLATDWVGLAGYLLYPSGITSLPGTSGAATLALTYVGNCSFALAAGLLLAAPGAALAGALLPADG